MVTIKSKNTVELRSNNGEVLTIDLGSYELARSLLKMAQEMSPDILRAAAQHWESDPEEKTESAFLAKFMGMYLEYIQA